MLEFLYIDRLGPVVNGVHLPLVHLYTSLVDDISKELDGWHVELAFLQLEIELVFSQLLEDLRHVLAMFGQVPGVDQDVDVDDDEAVEVLPEHLIHIPLEYGGGVGQAIQHHLVLVVACRGNERLLPFIPLAYSNEDVGAPQVQFGVDASCSNAAGSRGRG